MLENFLQDKIYMTYNEIIGTDFRTCKITNLESDCIEMFFNKK